MQTLNQFIYDYMDDKNSGRILSHSNAYVKCVGFSHMYVRIGRRDINGVKYNGVIDIANVQAISPGKGTFSELSDELHVRGFNVYVESVLNDRFCGKLLRMGYTQVPDREPPSFYLLAT